MKRSQRLSLSIAAAFATISILLASTAPASADSSKTGAASGAPTTVEEVTTPEPVKEKLRASIGKSLQKMAEFKHGPFSMKYPSNWRKGGGVCEPGQIMMFQTEQGLVSVIVGIQKITDKDTLATYNQARVDGLKKALGSKMTVISNSPLSIKGTKAMQLTYRGDIDQDGKLFKVRQQQILALNGGTAYNAQFNAPDELFNDFQQIFNAMIDSMVIADSKEASSR